MEQQKKQRHSQRQLLWIFLGLIPLLAYTLGVLWLFVQQQENAIEHVIDEAANNAAHIVERAIGEQIGVLKTLSSSKYLDNGNFVDFRKTAKRIWDLHDEWRTVIITDEKSPIFNLRYSPGEPITPLRDPESLKIVWTTQKPYIGNNARGYTAIRIPVIRDSQIIYTLVAPVDPKYFKDAIISTQSIYNENFFIAGSDGVVITASDGANYVKGAIVPAAIIKNGQSTSTESGTIYSKPVSIASSGWKVVVIVSEDKVGAPFEKKRAVVFIVGGLSVLLAAILILVLSSLWISKEKALILKDNIKKQYEAQIREKQAVKAGNIGLWNWDLITDEVEFSTEWKSQIGYEDNEISNDFKEWESRVHPDDLSRTLEKVKKSIDEVRQDHEVEFRFRHKNGTYRWILAQASIVPDESGKPGRMIGSHIDITEQKKTMIALQESESRRRTVLETINDGVILQSQSGEILSWNKGAEDIFGISAKDALGQTPEDRDWPTIHADGSKYEGKDHPSMQTLLTGESCKNEIMGVYHPSGDLHWISINSNPIFSENSNKPDSVAISFSDVTEYKQTLEKLMESKERYRVLFEDAPLPYQSLDKNGSFVEVNKKWLELLGYRRDEIIGMSFADLLHPDWKDHFRSNFPKFKSIGEILGVEFELKKKDGAYIWVMFDGRIRRDTQGSFIQTHCVFQDITAQRRLEKKLKDQERALVKAQKMESIGNLAGGIAHDFNNILSSIIGFTELALEDVPKYSSVEDSLQEIYTAGKRAKELVKQILAFARQSEEKRIPIQLSAIAEEVMHFIRSTVPTTIEIRHFIESDSLILGNETQIHQVLMNLCTNSAYAMEEDSNGVLEMSIRDVGVDKEDASMGMMQGDYIEIKVSDTGRGIAPDVIEFIFEPYFTTKGPGKGTGLGLAMAKGVIESCSGKIYVESNLGNGTTFKILLPITKKKSPEDTSLQEQLPTGNERILFVDDEYPIAKMGGQILERLDYKVTTRTSSMEALELFKVKPDYFDLVVTDMTMPNLSGDQLAIELMKIRPDIPVILCTGYSNKISDETATEIGVKAFAYKPMVKADLAKTVRKVLDEANG